MKSSEAEAKQGPPILPSRPRAWISEKYRPAAAQQSSPNPSTPTPPLIASRRRRADRRATHATPLHVRRTPTRAPGVLEPGRLRRAWRGVRSAPASSAGLPPLPSTPGSSSRCPCSCRGTFALLASLLQDLTRRLQSPAPAARQNSQRPSRAVLVWCVPAATWQQQLVHGK